MYLYSILHEYKDLLGLTSSGAPEWVSTDHGVFQTLRVLKRSSMCLLEGMTRGKVTILHKCIVESHNFLSQ